MIIKNKTIITTSDWFNLYLIGDFHIGQSATDTKKLDDSINYLSSKDSTNSGVILLGDLIENVVPGSKGSPFELNIPDPEKQMDLAATYITKIENILLASVEGNHELRTRHRTGQLLGKNILEKVYSKKKSDDYYLGLCGILNLTFKNTKGKLLQSYKIFVTHGTGNSGSISGKLTKVHSLKDRAYADLYFQGHLHYKLGLCDYIIKDDVIQKRIFACCSSYLIDAEYAQEFGFKPADYGINTISINTRESNMIGYF